jgi:hypothetical protein
MDLHADLLAEVLAPAPFVLPPAVVAIPEVLTSRYAAAVRFRNSRWSSATKIETLRSVSDALGVPHPPTLEGERKNWTSLLGIVRALFLGTKSTDTLSDQEVALVRRLCPEVHNAADALSVVTKLHYSQAFIMHLPSPAFESPSGKIIRAWGSACGISSQLSTPDTRAALIAGKISSVWIIFCGIVTAMCFLCIA